MKVLMIIAVISLTLLARDDFTIVPVFDKGSSIKRVGINNRSIAFSTSLSSSFEHMFSLSRMKIDDRGLDDLRFKNIKTAWNSYTLTLPIDDLGNDILDVRHMGSYKFSLNRRGTEGVEHSVYGFLKDGTIISGGQNGVIDAYNINGEKLASFIGHEGRINSLTSYQEWIVSGGDDGLIQIWEVAELTKGKKKIYPFMSLFFSKDGEWVAWTPEGFYTASDEGSTMLNYTLGHENKELNARQLFKNLYRPDIMLLKIKNRKLYDHIVVQGKEGLFDSNLPPKVVFTNITNRSENRDVDISINICDTGAGIKELMLYLRGIPISIEEATRSLKLKQNRRKGECYDYTRTVSLEPGDNEVVFIASNLKNIESQPIKKIINFNGEETLASLHILSIAVDNYNNKNLRLKYSVNDAKAVEKQLVTMGNSSFKNIFRYSLYDQEVTKDGIFNMFKEIGTKIKPEDVFIFYLSGHGVSDSKDAAYYYLPVDVEYENHKQLLSDSLSSHEFRELFTNIKAYKSLTLIDTCQSGSLSGFNAKTLTINTSQTRFISTVGRAIIMASSKDQVAYEGYKEHGAFTYSLLEALQGKADIQKDGEVTIDEVATYISHRLPELTLNKWGYRQEPQRNLVGNNFVLGKSYH